MATKRVDPLETQIQATQELGWQTIEARNITVPGHPKANLHDLPDAAFDLAVEQLEAARRRRLLLRLDDHELGEDDSRSPVRGDPGRGASAPSRA